MGQLKAPKAGFIARPTKAPVQPHKYNGDDAWKDFKNGLSVAWNNPTAQSGSKEQAAFVSDWRRAFDYASTLPGIGGLAALPAWALDQTDSVNHGENIHPTTGAGATAVGKLLPELFAGALGPEVSQFNNYQGYQMPYQAIDDAGAASGENFGLGPSSFASNPMEVSSPSFFDNLSSDAQHFFNGESGYALNDSVSAPMESGYGASFL